MTDFGRAVGTFHLTSGYPLQGRVVFTARPKSSLWRNTIYQTHATLDSNGSIDIELPLLEPHLFYQVYFQVHYKGRYVKRSTVGFDLAYSQTVDINQIIDNRYSTPDPGSTPDPDGSSGGALDNYRLIEDLNDPGTMILERYTP